MKKEMKEFMESMSEFNESLSGAVMSYLNDSIQEETYELAKKTMKLEGERGIDTPSELYDEIEDHIKVVQNRTEQAKKLKESFKKISKTETENDKNTVERDYSSEYNKEKIVLDKTVDRINATPVYKKVLKFVMQFMEHNSSFDWNGKSLADAFLEKYEVKELADSTIRTYISAVLRYAVEHGAIVREGKKRFSIYWYKDITQIPTEAEIW